MQSVRERRSHSRQGAMISSSGRQRAERQLEANLVVALARRAVGDRVAAGLARHLAWCFAISGRARAVPSR